MNQLYYSPEALNDLDEIHSYIINEFQDSAAAQKTVSHILDAVEKLWNFAEIGAWLSSITEIVGDYRYLVCGKYIVFYRARGNDIYIDRILYGHRDYLHILFPDIPDGQ